MRIRVAALAALTAWGVIGCSPKPTEDQCEKAVANIRKLTGQADTEVSSSERRGAVRSCQAQSNRKMVDCIIAADSEQALASCGGGMAEVIKKAKKARGDQTAPDKSAPPPGGTTAPAPGSQGAPPPTGSGAPPPTGSGAPPPSGSSAPPAESGAPPPTGSGAPPPTGVPSGSGQGGK